MRGWLRRLLGTLAIAILIAGPIGARAAQDALPEAIQETLLEAAAQGDEALLQAIQAAVAANPELAQAIADAATQLKPELGAQIAAAATGEAFEFVPAAGSGSSFGPLLAGLGVLGGGAAAGGGGGGGGGGGSPVAAPVLEPGEDPPPEDGNDPPPEEGDDPPPDDGSGSPAPGGPDPGGGDSDPPPPPGPVPADFETDEYNAQAGLGLVNASDAYARGLTGAGIIIGLFDTGLDVSHPEFAGRIAANAFDFIRDTSDITDPSGHGTHVAGIAGANRDDNGMHGVAYGALLMPLTVLDEDGGGSLTNGTLVDAIHGT